MSRLLVIDDNVLVGKMLKEALSEEGFEVRVATDANQGYAAAIEFHPDLILLDVQLPDVTGSDLIPIIKNRDDLKQIPIIMITGTHGQTDHKVKAFQAGADDYVLKPFEMPELIERIKAVLRRSSKRSSSPHVVSGDPASLLNVAGPPLTNRGGDTLRPAGTTPPPRLSLRQAVSAILCAPWSIPVQAVWPPVSFFFLTTALGLSLGGLALSAGAAAKPAVVGLSVAGLWGGLVVVLVVISSLLGISMTWKEGATVVSLSATPLLLKLAGGVVTAIVTTLSPFYFTASPALFWDQAPAWASRLDLFELWAVFLVGLLVRQRPGASRQKARVVMLCVWGVGIVLGIALGKMGGGQ